MDVRAWPLFELTLSHGDLLMREATDDDVLALAGLVEDGIVEPGTEYFMPNLLLGRRPTLGERRADFLRYHWGRRARTSASAWEIAFAVVRDGEVIGSQAVHGREFAVRREVMTGSYLGRRHQGRGIGTRMRAMALELAFGHLRARWARSGYLEGNVRSAAVSRRLGYEADGIGVIDAAGEARTEYRVRLGAESWRVHRPAWLDEMVVNGAGEAGRFLGL